MLVLSRKAGQRIQIGENVFVTITAIKGNRITLGIEAPSEVAIRRSELVSSPSLSGAGCSHCVETAKQVA